MALLRSAAILISWYLRCGFARVNHVIINLIILQEKWKEVLDILTDSPDAGRLDLKNTGIQTYSHGWIAFPVFTAVLASETISKLMLSRIENGMGVNSYPRISSNNFMCSIADLSHVNSLALSNPFRM